jgi:Transposase, Mutator family
MTMAELADLADQDVMIEPMTVDSIDQRELAEQLLEQAKEQNIELVGPGGLLGQLTKSVLETALDAEMSEHLGYEKHDPAGRGSGNSRNGTRAKTVLTEDRAGRDRGSAGYRVDVRAADRPQAPAPLDRGG